jgi:hypothetical protein
MYTDTVRIASHKPIVALSYQDFTLSVLCDDGTVSKIDRIDRMGSEVSSSGEWNVFDHPPVRLRQFLGTVASPI